jgi:hypothetical protein
MREGGKSMDLTHPMCSCPSQVRSTVMLIPRETLMTIRDGLMEQSQPHRRGCTIPEHDRIPNMSLFINLQHLTVALDRLHEQIIAKLLIGFILQRDHGADLSFSLRDPTPLTSASASASDGYQSLAMKEDFVIFDHRLGGTTSATDVLVLETSDVPLGHIWSHR